MKQRFVLATAIVAMTASVLMGTAMASADASAADGRSFAGCPKLGEGDSGPCVERLQGELDDALPQYGLATDGRFGSATRIAVLDFQGRNHLGADGIVGPATANLLDQQAGPRSVSLRGGTMCYEQGLSSDNNGKCGGPLDPGAAIPIG